MKSTNLTLKSAIAGALALGVIGLAQTASANPMDNGKMAQQEKCYGVNAANKNDCQSPGHSCAGQDAKARDPNAFVLTPAGLCAKIGGSTSPASKM